MEITAPTDNGRLEEEVATAAASSPAPVKKRKSPLHDLAMELGLEMLERRRAREPVRFSLHSPRGPRPTPAELQAAAEEKAKREQAEQREWRRARYAREKALRLGLPAPLPPVTPRGRRRAVEEAERVAKAEALLAFVRARNGRDK